MSDLFLKSARTIGLTSVATLALAAASAAAQTAPPRPTTPVEPEQAEPSEQTTQDIIVTARLRNEGLMDTPVAVAAISAESIAKYNAADLTKIGELTPTVIISNYKLNGGGSIAIRGISSPASQVGFEQPVSVSIDGIQTSSGKVAMLGFFDLQQVEVLKGPQALFFGKNSPAGVISVSSAGPTSSLEIGGRSSYEFIGDEVSSEGYIAGPISDTLGGRLAVKLRSMKGWLYNNGLAAPNPFYRAGQPVAAAIVPGRPSRRIGEDEVIARATLEWKPSSVFTASLKLFGYKGNDQGSGSYSQNIGPCTDGKPRSFGVVDPFGDCKIDNQTSYGSIAQGVAAGLPRANGDGRARGILKAYVASLSATLRYDNFAVTSTTGLIHDDYYSISALDQTIYGGLIVLEDTQNRTFSQQLRLLTDFDGPFNFLIGGYFEDARSDLYNDGAFRNDISFNPANNRYDTYEKLAYNKGRTYSAFGQLIWKPFDKLEVAGGGRFTREIKNTRAQNIYGRTTALGAFDTSQTLFVGSNDRTPGVLAGKFTDNNFSPEVTVSYHPVADSTIYAAYKTGYKSGGFGITSPITTGTTLADIDFESETVKGFEVGAKAFLFDRKLRLTSAAFAYNFRNLQVTTYDATLFRYQINNAGKVKQRGVELEGEFRVTPEFKLRAAGAYVHNRISGYIGQCYGFTIPATAAQTAQAPSGCSFVLNANGSRFLTPAGTPVLQQVNDGRPPARSPDFSGNVGADFDFAVGTGLTAGLSGDAFYSDYYYASDSYSPNSIQPSFWRFNLAARLGAEDGSWQVAFVGRNLSDEKFLLFAGDRTGGTSVPLIPGEQRAVTARGREFVIQTSFKF